MNSAPISIGTFKPMLREKSIERAKRIGKVEIDHGRDLLPNAQCGALHRKGVEAETTV
jgi:hypothetical protein